MKRIYFGSQGLGDWQRHLADSTRHWKRGRSAFELAVSWERASKKEGHRGLPMEIQNLLDKYSELQGAELLSAIPEHIVNLAGMGFGSHTDLWALLRSEQGLISLAIEAKAGETFDDAVEGWLQASRGKDSGTNRRNRLKYLCETLGLVFDEVQMKGLRYQLFHRVASALLEAKRCHTAHAVVLVQDFGGQGESSSDFDDFRVFGDLLGAQVSINRLVEARAIKDKRLWLGWIECKLANDDEVVGVVV